MIGSADANNPAMVSIAAYVTTTVVESDRAVTQCQTEWDEVRVEVDDEGLVMVEWLKVNFISLIFARRPRPVGCPVGAGALYHYTLSFTLCYTVSTKCLFAQCETHCAPETRNYTANYTMRISVRTQQTKHARETRVKPMRCVTQCEHIAGRPARAKPSIRRATGNRRVPSNTA